MPPLLADSRHASLLAIRPPKDIREVFAEYIDRIPELRTREAQALLRQRFIAIFNAATRNPSYARHVREPDDPLGTGDKVERARRAAKRMSLSETATHMMNVTKLLSDDVCLGLSYIHSKRGEKGVEEYLRRLDIEKIVVIGKQLRTERVEARENAIQMSNTCKPLITGSEQPEGYLCGKVWQHRDPPPRIKDVAQIEGWNVSVEYCERYIAYAEQTFGMTLPVCNQLLGNKHMWGYYEHMLTYCRPARAGFLELAMFAAVFCARHGTKPSKHIMIPDTLFSAFEGMFTFQDPFWSIRQEEIEALFAACQTLFPDDPLGRELLERSISILTNKANDRSGSETLDEPHGSPLRILKLFPDPGMQQQAARQHADSAHYMFMQDTVPPEITRLTEKELSSAFVFSARDILMLDNSDKIWLPDLARAHRSGLEWHTVLLDSEPAAVAEVIEQLFLCDDILCNSVAAELSLLFLSQDPAIYASRDSMQQIFGENSPYITKSKYLQALTEILTSENMYFTADYLRVFSRMKSHGEERTVAELFQLMDEQSELPPLLHAEYWHPLLSKGTLDLDAIIDVLLRTDAKDIPKTQEYLIARNLCSDEQDWAKLLWKLRGGTIYHAVLETALLACVNPGKIGVGCTMLHYAEVQAGICERLAEIDPKRYALGRNIGFLDLPMEMFIDADPHTVASLNCWREGSGILRCNEQFSPDLCAEMRGVVDVYCRGRGSTAKTLFEDVEISTEFSDFFLASRSAFTHDDLRLVTGLCMDDGHGLLLPITRKALMSSADIQEELLTGALRVSDAADVACALLGELARKGKDKQTVGDLGLEQWNTRIPLNPKRYALIHRICANATLRNELVATLQDCNPTMPLRELSAHLYPPAPKK